MPCSHFDQGYLINDSENADCCACLIDSVAVIGDRLVVGDEWCDMLEEMVVVLLIDRRVLVVHMVTDIEVDGEMVWTSFSFLSFRLLGKFFFVEAPTLEDWSNGFW